MSQSSFALCAVAMLKAEAAKLERGELTKITYDNTKYRIDKLVLPYFKSLICRRLQTSALLPVRFRSMSMIMDAVCSIERLLTSMIGQPQRRKRRFASTISRRRCS